MLIAKLPLRPSHLRKSCSVIRLLGQSRQLLTLAIETSCDDTSVAILENHDTPNSNGAYASLHFHEKVTADNSAYRGIHPVIALESHAKHLAGLVHKSMRSLPMFDAQSLLLKQDAIAPIALQDGTLRHRPDFVTVTRGPGMRSNLAVGLDTAKGLSLGWQIPLLGVHHMQAHALTPRLASALDNNSAGIIEPQFPFLSLLVSGGHTMLLHSKSLTDHEMLATSADIAVGEALDKIGRELLPQELLQGTKDTMYAKLLSEWAFPTPESMTTYKAPARRGQEIDKPPNEYGWSVQAPFANTKDLKFSFAGIPTRINQISSQSSFTSSQRLPLARAALTTSFEHLASRTVLALESLKTKSQPLPSTLVLSGGVASNPYLKHIIRQFLDIRGFTDIKLSSPPPALCTDNAAMIAWTGIEMWEAGYVSDFEIIPVRKWGMDNSTGVSAGGGVLGIGGWRKRDTGEKVVG